MESRGWMFVAIVTLVLIHLHWMKTPGRTINPLPRTPAMNAKNR